MGWDYATNQSELPDRVIGHLEDEGYTGNQFVVGFPVKKGVIRTKSILTLISNDLYVVSINLFDETGTVWRLSELDSLIVKGGDGDYRIYVADTTDSKLVCSATGSERMIAFLTALHREYSEIVDIEAPPALLKQSKESEDHHRRDQRNGKRAHAHWEYADALVERGEYEHAVREYDSALTKYRTARMSAMDEERIDKFDQTINTISTAQENAEEKRDVVAEVAKILKDAETHLTEASDALATERSVVAQTRYRQADNRYKEAEEKLSSVEVNDLNLEVEGQSFTSRTQIKTRREMASAGLFICS
ncbi:hypothetical protein J2752_002002 [Halarchaeum rubridurum]|uniref:Uncharacterized protein n=1 Tax=Halarchaeum rubridurum TaxID=489911 RepID=A0A830G0D5_9EURY|nr:hypothetical protein [Halarchaeum rubridurum]MBP1955090.1 hypothetical protein [Halarchaeum rubridurum]GGM69015.1 hypothetical protein GCM10009017_19050 [Halarchaeum rubridurum]